jgi:hypothetical protein
MLSSQVRGITLRVQAKRNLLICHSETKSKNLLPILQRKILRSFLPQDDKIRGRSRTFLLTYKYLAKAELDSGPPGGIIPVQNLGAASQAAGSAFQTTINSEFHFTSIIQTVW